MAQISVTVFDLSAREQKLLTAILSAERWRMEKPRERTWRYVSPRHPARMVLFECQEYGCSGYANAEDPGAAFYQARDQASAAAAVKREGV